MFEKPFFPLHPSAISDEFSGFSDDAMTRNNYYNRIHMVGSTDSSYGFWISDHDRLFEIVSRFSVWDFTQCFPRFFLKFCSRKSELYRKIFSFFFEIFSKFFFCLFEDCIFSFSQICSLCYFLDFFREFYRIRKIEKKKGSVIC